MTASEGAASRPRPTPLRLTGRVDQIDASRRSLRIGSHTIQLPQGVPLNGLRVGDRVTVKGMRDPISGRISALAVLSLDPRYSKTSAERPSGRLMPLVVGMLAEISPSARVRACELLPAIDSYAIRIEIPGSQDGAALIPKQVMERAPDDPNVHRTVRSVLQAAVTLLRSRGALDLIRRDPPQSDLRELA